MFSGTIWINPFLIQKSPSYPSALPASDHLCSCSVAESCPILWDHMDYSPPASCVRRIFQISGKHWSGLPFPTPGDLCDPRIEPASLTLAGRFFVTSGWFLNAPETEKSLLLWQFISLPCIESQCKNLPPNAFINWSLFGSKNEA